LLRRERLGGGFRVKEAIVVADPQGIIRHWSPDAEELFGHAAADAVGRSLDVIVPPGGLRERHWSALRRATATGEMKLDRATTNVPVLCKDGSVRAFPGRFHLLQGPRGEVAGYVGVFGERAGNEEPFTDVVPLP
jgi:PAS domain S-box-containing protein